MKKEFLDECKDRVFEALLDKEGQTFESKYDLVDEISYYISDDVIYYSEGHEALKMYPDEFSDYWEESGYIYKEARDFNPFSDEGVLDVWRGLLSQSCSFITEDIIKGFGDGSITLKNKVLLSLSKKLDHFDKYPFSEEKYFEGCYPYCPEEKSYYQEAKERLLGSPSMEMEGSKEDMSKGLQSTPAKERKETIDQTKTQEAQKKGGIKR